MLKSTSARNLVETCSPQGLHAWHSRCCQSSPLLVTQLLMPQKDCRLLSPHQVLLEQADEAHEAQDAHDARKLLQNHHRAVDGSALQHARPRRLRSIYLHLLAARVNEPNSTTALLRSGITWGLASAEERPVNIMHWGSNVAIVWWGASMHYPGVAGVTRQEACMDSACAALGAPGRCCASWHSWARWCPAPWTAWPRCRSRSTCAGSSRGAP